MNKVNPTKFMKDMYCQGYNVSEEIKRQGSALLAVIFFLEQYEKFKKEIAPQEIVEAQDSATNTTKVETATLALCKGMPHGSCKGETMCESYRKCFIPA
jgi:hypothetical protein